MFGLPRFQIIPFVSEEKLSQQKVLQEEPAQRALEVQSEWSRLARNMEIQLECKSRVPAPQGRPWCESCQVPQESKGGFWGRLFGNRLAEEAQHVLGSGQP